MVSCNCTCVLFLTAFSFFATRVDGKQQMIANGGGGGGEGKVESSSLMNCCELGLCATVG